MICNATFISVWDGGFHIETPCKVNTTTGEIFDIEIINADVDILEYESVRLDNGKEYEITDKAFYWYE